MTDLERCLGELGDLLAIDEADHVARGAQPITQRNLKLAQIRLDQLLRRKPLAAARVVLRAGHLHHRGRERDVHRQAAQAVADALPQVVQRRRRSLLDRLAVVA